MPAARHKDVSTGSPSSSRTWYPWLDSAKGFGIILVVLGHASLVMPLNRTLYAFHMPLFFIISGLLFKEHPLRDTATRKARRLLVPYLTFAVLTFAYWALIERRLRPGNYSVVDAFLNIFLARGGTQYNPYNVVLWFLPCLFVTEMLFAVIYALLKHVAKTGVPLSVMVAVSGVLMFIAGYGMTRFVNATFRLPFALDIVPFAYGCFAIGYLAKPLLPFLGNLRKLDTPPRLALCLPAALLFGAVASLTLWTGLRIDLNNAVVSNVALLAVTAVIGTTATFLLCIALDDRILRYLGSASLTIMCVHDPIKRIVIVLVSKILHVSSETARTNGLMLALIVGITIIIALIAHEIIRRLLPEALGMSRRRS
ncbi:acyltransferase family protein [Bifidobacterium parmae]|uniref:Acyltransferase 3 n=1 Tax=Bifidobacterium parmae TaxID=361854 RepID=A0A2N5J0I4_9BIFI|nr:acyltransferase family protein [Bifidobacterium parmae]PLS27701.1 acyltransferase 3 [Bifidobacterium parmae]